MHNFTGCDLKSQDSVLPLRYSPDSFTLHEVSSLGLEGSCAVLVLVFMTGTVQASLFNIVSDTTKKEVCFIHTSTLHSTLLTPFT